MEEPETARTDDETGAGTGGEQMAAMSENNMREFDSASELYGRDKVGHHIDMLHLNPVTTVTEISLAGIYEECLLYQN